MKGYITHSSHPPPPISLPLILLRHSCSDDGTVKLWDIKTGEFIRDLVDLNKCVCAHDEMRVGMPATDSLSSKIIQPQRVPRSSSERRGRSSR